MDSLRSGTFMGSGSFRCTHCGYIVTLDGSERLPECPSCGAEEFVRASMFSTERIAARVRADLDGCDRAGGALPRAGHAGRRGP